MTSDRRQPVWVYAIVSPLTAKLKIGVASDVGERLSQLQRGGPDEDLYILWFCRGGEEQESTIHEHLDSLGLHSHFEWYHFPATVRADIKKYLEEFAKNLLTENSSSDILKT
jgi:hypothetical protein